LSTLALARDRQAMRALGSSLMISASHSTVPVRALLVDHLDRLDVVEEFREVFEVPPEGVEVPRRAVDGEALLDVDAALEVFLRPGGVWLVAGGVDAEGIVGGAVAGDATVDQPAAQRRQQQPGQ
jgi:hypothetical protein